MKPSVPSRAAFAAGLLALGAYWYSVHPPGFANGYSADMCNHEMARQLMAEQLDAQGRPGFRSDSVMTPTGMSLPFYAGWNIERDWLGAYVWRMDREFPYLWALHGASLLFSYLAVGLILGRMGLRGPAAWGLALFFVLFHFPRHMKLWPHSDNTMLHWVYAGFFLDAWIWQRWVRERRWSLHLEAWRALVLLGVFGTMGYGWGPDLMVLILVRAAMLAHAIARRRANEPFRIEANLRSCALPLGLSFALLAVQLLWFVPLVAEASKAGLIEQGGGWPAHPGYVVRPLWLDRVAPWLGLTLPYPRFDTPETVVSAGWVYVLPFFLALVLLASKERGRGLLTVAPFLAAILAAVLYMNPADHSHLVVRAVGRVFPFMKFFRTWSRWGLFLPPLFAVVITLSLPELEAFWERLAHGAEPSGRLRPRALVAAALFIAMGALEVAFLRFPVAGMPPLAKDARSMLEGIRDQPGTTVLTLPFCVAGANGICVAEQCPLYPFETIAHCLRLFHGKKVYGSYTSRMTLADCRIYDRAPFDSWFEAWRAQRCFDGAQWSQLCAYLGAHRELAAVVVFPDLWRAAGASDCKRELRNRLGPPVAEAVIATEASRVPPLAPSTRARWYRPSCAE